MKRFFYAFIILAFFSSCSDQKQKKSLESLTSPIEEAQFSQLTSHQDIMDYLVKVDSLSPEISLEIVGESVEGRSIPLVKVSRDGNIHSELTKIFLFAQQHGDEPSGKEGLLLFINDLAKGDYNELLKKVNLLIMPQVNPDGGEKNKRRNANGIDLNRDHLVLEAPETQAVHKAFNSYLPEVTVDIHEYGAFSDYWMKFGYRKDFDIQLGGLTNINVDHRIRDLFYTRIKPYVREKVTHAGYSFFEYTLGDLPAGERMRHSTVDVNDGRQSLGILNSLSFIVEGKYGRDSVDNLKNRAKSQYVTAKGIVEYVLTNVSKVDKLVEDAREKLYKAEKGEEVAVRMRHTRGEESLEYPLKSVKTGKDTIFIVEEYHSQVISLLDVQTPSGYLIPRNDQKLENWLKRSYIDFYEYAPTGQDQVYQYKITMLRERVDEGLKNYYPEVEKVDVSDAVNPDDYFFVPINQLRSTKVVTALEPQSMLGLINYSEFEYLIQQSPQYPILRVIKP